MTDEPRDGKTGFFRSVAERLEFEAWADKVLEIDRDLRRTMTGGDPLEIRAIAERRFDAVEYAFSDDDLDVVAYSRAVAAGEPWDFTYAIAL